jgi:hypothetical protein
MITCHSNILEIDNCEFLRNYTWFIKCFYNVPEQQSHDVYVVKLLAEDVDMTLVFNGNIAFADDMLFCPSSLLCILSIDPVN